VDPLSSPSVVTNANEGPNWLRAVQNIVGRNGRESYAVIRCFYRSSSILVCVSRFKSSDDIRPDWGTDKETRVTPEKLPKVGDEVRFYQRHGMHDNIAFRRGAYLVDVEGVSTPIDKLAQMAEVLDGNLLRAQGKQSER